MRCLEVQLREEEGWEDECLERKGNEAVCRLDIQIVSMMLAI